MSIKPIIRTILAAGVVSAAMAVSAFAFDVQGGTVNTASAVNFRQEPSTESAVLDKLYNGTRVAVLDQKDDWYQVAYDGDVGYMSAQYIETQPVMNIVCGGAKVTASSSLNLRTGPGTEHNVLSKLSSGVVAKIIGINSGWFKVQYGGKTGYVSPEYVEVVAFAGNYGTSSTSTASSSGSSAAAKSSGGTAAAATGTRQEIIDYAATLLGCKYVYGGSTKSGFDCSGFTMHVFSQFGISLSHSSATQYTKAVSISKSELQVGDLIFFSQKKGSTKVGHVGIYVGDNEFIHAASPGKGVRYDDLDSDYYLTHYIGCGRVLSD